MRKLFVFCAACAACLVNAFAEGLAPFNVRDFGAVGDGVHDDTLAIQKAAKAVYGGTFSADYKARKGWRDLRTRNVDSGAADGPVREIFFPKGVYRVTGPVLFEGSLNVRGEEGTVVRNDTPTEDTFYFDYGFRVRVDNMAFEGGRTQLRPCTYNWTDATLFVSRCRFSKSAGPALRLDAHRLDDGTPGDWRKNPYACSPYEIAWTDEGRVRLTSIDEKRLANWYSSTLGTVENCTFTDCAQAFALYSDGIIVRDSTVRTTVAAPMPVAWIFGTVHLDRVRFDVAESAAAGRPAILEASIRSCLTDCEFRSPAPLAAVEYMSKACTLYVGGQLTMKDCRVDTAGCAVRFPEDCFPNTLAIDGLKGSGRRLFDFDKVPSPEEVTAWPTSKKKNFSLPKAVTIDRCIGISLLNIDGGFDATLPPSLAPYVRDYPKDLRQRVAERPDYAVPEGPVFSDPAIGATAYPGGDDTERVQTLFDRAAKEKTATVELPAAWIVTRAPIRVSGRVHVVVRGRAVWRSDDAGPALRIAEGSALTVENVVFHRGGNVAWCDGGRGKLTFRNAYFMDQLRESLHARRASDKMPGWRIEMDGGVVDTPKLFAGEASPLFLNGIWLTICADHKFLKHRPSYVSIENYENGDVLALDVLGVPRYFENREVFGKTPGTVGDYRWFDNFGKMRVFQMRFGGERHGITSLYSYPGASTYVEGGFSYQNCNGHLRPGNAAAQISSDKDDVRFVDVSGFNLNEDPAFYVGVQQADGTCVKVHKGHVFNCYPLTSK